MISRWIFDWRVLIRLTCSVSWSLHQLICRVTGYFKVGLFIYVNSWCLFWLVLLSWWGWPKWEMMLINMGNAPVLMHLSLLFSCNIKHPAKKRKKKKKKKKSAFGVLACLLIHLHLEVETTIHNFGNTTIAVPIFSYLCKDW